MSGERPDDFAAAMAEAGVVALWQKPPYPPRAEAPRHWRWRDIRPLLDRAVEETDMETAERRVLTLVAPEFGRTDAAAEGDRVTSVTNLSANFQVLLPGETAPPHRHSMGALRFVVEGQGATTSVDNTVCEMAPGDMILTPAWTWHAHANPGTGPVIWLDLLDAPLIKQLDIAEFERPGAATGVRDRTGDVTGPLHFPLAAARRGLAAAPPDGQGRRVWRYERQGGRPALDLVDCELWGLPADKDVATPAGAENRVCLVVDGQGESRVGESVFAWEKNDVFTVPHGNGTRHRATGGDALLFVGSDREILRRLGHLNGD